MNTNYTDYQEEEYTLSIQTRITLYVVVVIAIGVFSVLAW